MGKTLRLLIVHSHASYGSNLTDYLTEDGYPAEYLNPVEYVDKDKPGKVVEELVKKTKEFEPGIIFNQHMDLWKEFVEQVREEYENIPIVGFFPKGDECLECFPDKETMEREKKKYTKVLIEPVPYEKIIEIIKKHDP